MGRTKKVGPAGRFGSRYGVKIRKAVRKIEEIQRMKQKCPYCGYKSVKRLGTGIFECRKCGKKIAGGCYVLKTITGEEVVKALESKR